MRPDSDEEICLDARLHGAVLARPIARSSLLVLAGMAAQLIPWAVGPVLGAILIAAGAAFTLRAVWQWERTRVVVTTERVLVVAGTLRRRSKTVRLQAVEEIEVEQSLVGQLFGYGTLIVGPISIRHLGHPAQVSRLVERLAS